MNFVWNFQSFSLKRGRGEGKMKLALHNYWTFPIKVKSSFKNSFQSPWTIINHFFLANFNLISVFRMWTPDNLSVIKEKPILKKKYCEMGWCIEWGAKCHIFWNFPVIHFGIWCEMFKKPYFFLSISR